ncbi:M16 family metallopeptidase [Arsenicicoccus dermatophilus]|uniref:M16 family metallopeptidase n=1 Tax=Arsenicicoccus dermatophilus TaxID=1076331 RepID=UPI001F4D0BAD|nr:pitrilysin family protein [Arsenicicoccus dermatophilus]MCH8613625.1 insulinase family protein [Arsenicicoccus dermatophilus]
MSQSTIPPRPQVGEPAAWAFPTPSEHVLDNGLRLQVFHTPGQYVASVRLAVPAFPALEPLEQEGLLAILSRTFDEGTQNHTAEEFAELLEHGGIALGSSTSEFGMVLDLDVAVARLERGMELFAECVRRPAFPEDEIERARRRRLADIEQETADPRSRAAREFARTFYDPDARASRPSAGTPQSVRAITAESVRAFHTDHVGPLGATLVVAGDLSPLGPDATTVVRDLVERFFGDWAAQRIAPTAPQAPVRRDDAARIVVVDRPGSVQSELYVGCLGPDRRHGWGAYPVLSFLLGGSPQARVDAVLREDKGYTYGMRTSFVPRAHDGLLLASGSVRADATAESVQLLLTILEDARAGFEADEVRDGVAFVSMTAPGRYATADAIADEAAGLALEGLPPTWVTEMLTQTRELEPQALLRAYERAQVGVWTVVVVGDAAQVAPQLTALGRGEVEVRDR